MNDSDTLAAECRFDPESPLWAGHYPQQPIVPGMLIMDRLLSELHAATGAEWLIRSARFLAPAFPGDRITLEAAVRAADARAVCTVAGRTIASARLIAAP